MENSTAPRPRAITFEEATARLPAMGTKLARLAVDMELQIAALRYVLDQASADLTARIAAHEAAVAAEREQVPA